MRQPAILGAATAVPDHRYQQMELYEDVMADIYQNRRAPAIFRATEIESRYSVIPEPQWLMANPSAEARNDLYMAEAPLLGEKAARNALAAARLSIEDIDDFIVVSCTGLDTPGLDVLVAEQLGMSPTTRRTAIIGMGCHGLLPGLHRAATAVQANASRNVLILTLELCTLHLQHENNIRNILGSALFGDGASATVIGPANGGVPSLIDTMTYSDYKTQTEMSFHPGNYGYRIYLSTKIPKILRRIVPDLMAQFLQRNALQLKDIKHWIVHPGGMKILEYIEQALELEPDDLQHAKAILREYGNMSSATLLFVLERHLQHEKPAAGEYGVILGFGPGLTVEFGLMQWQ